MATEDKKSSIFSSSEDVISMFLGLVVVVVTAWIIFNFFQRKRGSVEVPGVTSNTATVAENVTVTGTGTVQPTGKVEEKKTVVSTGGTEYVVLKGDSLWKIAQKNYGSGYNWVDIAKENKLKNPSKLRIGMKLIMPSKVEEKKVEMTEYKVSQGDSLWKISVKEYGDGFQWVKVWQANRNVLVNPNRLEIGMKLSLPKLTRIAK